MFLEINDELILETTGLTVSKHDNFETKLFHLSITNRLMGKNFSYTTKEKRDDNYLKVKFALDNISKFEFFSVYCEVEDLYKMEN